MPDFLEPKLLKKKSDINFFLTPIPVFNFFNLMCISNLVIKYFIFYIWLSN